MASSIEDAWQSNLAISFSLLSGKLPVATNRKWLRFADKLTGLS